MPEKTIREMSQQERRHYSLKARVFRAVLMGSLILGLVAMAIGLGLYTTALIEQETEQAFLQSKNAASVIQRVTDVEPLADLVMSTYEGLSEEERAETGTEAYRERYEAIYERGSFSVAQSVLKDFRDTSEVSDIYLAMYTRDPDRLIYIVDPDDDPETQFRPGEWEEVKTAESKRFLDLEWSADDTLTDVSLTRRYGWICTAGVPITNAEGKVICFVLADITLNEVADGMRLFLVQYIVAMLLAAIAVGLILTRRIGKTLVAPINEIAETARDYVQDKRSGVKITDHFSMLNIRTGDEIFLFLPRHLAQRMKQARMAPLFTCNYRMADSCNLPREVSCA